MPTVHLWLFPEIDFQAWRELVGSPQVNSYAEYLTLLAAIQADLERSGIKVVRVKLSVAQMRAEIETRNWPNTPDHRAAILALRGENDA